MEKNYLTFFNRSTNRLEFILVAVLVLMSLLGCGFFFYQMYDQVQTMEALKEQVQLLEGVLSEQQKRTQEVQQAEHNKISDSLIERLSLSQTQKTFLIVAIGLVLYWWLDPWMSHTLMVTTDMAYRWGFLLPPVVHCSLFTPPLLVPAKMVLDPTTGIYKLFVKSNIDDSYIEVDDLVFYVVSQAPVSYPFTSSLFNFPARDA